MNERSPQTPEDSDLFDNDRLLQREAGYGQPNGLNEEVLDAIKKREASLDIVVNNQHDVYEDEKERLWDDYMEKAAEVVRLKQLHGIKDPPAPEGVSPEGQ